MMPQADRDAALQHGLSRLPGDPSPEGPECLDAETVAAWMDRSLDAAAVEQVLAHVAGCARCQALVAALTRSDGAEGMAPNASAPEASTPSGARVLPWRRQWVAWALPLGAAATVLLAAFVWLRAPVPPDGTQNRTAQAAAPETAGERGRSGEQQGSAAPLAADSGANAAGPASATAAQASAAPPSPAPGRVGASGTAPSVGTPDAPQAKTIEPPLAGALRAASPERARLQAAAPQTDAAPAPGAAPAAAAEALAAPAAPPAPAATLDRLETRTGAPRWRVVEGRLEGSDDGRAWRTAGGTAATGAVAALSSATGAEVWAVGRAGLVLRTTDGASWVRVPPPAAADLIEVRATDARAATVRAADGRAWSTTDGGSTWAVAR